MPFSHQIQQFVIVYFIIFAPSLETISSDAHYLTNPQAYVIEKKTVDAESVLDVKMAAGGGFAISFEKCR
ncbi:MAG: glycoside hydrolase family 97 C-terminal domain-containing protein [Bacteroidales bacterium]|nr:glycoside hydrolase family 97 C-terminal domain-containing protein [Bacteroidales bacterium]